MSDNRWQGLAALVVDAVEHGSRAVQKIQKVTADRTFAIIEAVAPVPGLRAIQAINEASVAGVHAAIRFTGGLVGKVAGAALETRSK